MRIKINNNFDRINQTYLFSNIAARVRDYSKGHPDADIIRLGIGDVTLPLPSVITEAMQQAVLEMGSAETFRGYPPEYGYDFLKDAIVSHYKDLGVNISSSSVFVSDGAKSDLGNIVDILGNNEIIIPDPVYPVYVDSNLMNGNHINLLPGNMDNGFLPMPDELPSGTEAAVIYLCSPNNPTGAAYDQEQLEIWVSYAIDTGSLIIYDNAYEAFISEDLPHSIYSVPGAEECAIEICSFSKFAGFTGVRCGWTIIPDTLISEDGHQLSALWSRRQATKFNGVSYPVQRAAEAALSDKGIIELQKNIDYYRRNASTIASTLDDLAIRYTGGINSPYIWLECPDGLGSWDFFDKLLHKAQIVGTPGEGFGQAGEGFFRLTAFGTYENTCKAVQRLRKLL